MRTRAFRRHSSNIQKARIVRQQLQRCEFWRDLSPKNVGIKARTPKNCSCWMCGNPRHYYGSVTRQEEKSSIQMNEGMYE